MFFNPRRFWLATFLLLMLSPLFLLSCAGEDQPYRTVTEVDFNKVGSGGACLENFGVTLERFFSGDISQRELADFWTCMETSVKLFVDLTEGETYKNSYTPEELRHFLQQFFLGKDKISDGFLAALMEVKRVFVGGDIRSLSKKELLKGVEIFGHLKLYSLSSLPYMRLYSNQLSHDKNQEEEIEKQLPGAIANLDFVTSGMAGLLQENHQVYSFKNLHDFIFYFLESTNNKKTDSSFREFLKWIPLLQKIKGVLIGPDETQILPGEYPRFFVNLSRVMNIKMRYDYFLRGKSWTYGRPLLQLHQLLKVLYLSIDESLVFHSQNMITHQEVQGILNELAKHVEFPLGLSAAIMGKTWAQLVDVVLQPIKTKRRRRSESLGLDITSFNEFKQEVSRWFTIQQYLNDYDPTKDQTVLEHLQQIYITTSDRDKMSSIEEILRTLSSPYKFLMDDKSRLILSKDMIHLPYDHESLFAINWKRAIVRLIIRGYSETEEQRQNLSYLTVKQLEEAFADFFELVVAIGIADEEETAEHFVGNLYQLASLFLARSDGDEVISFEEGLEYFVFAMAGVDAGNDYFDQLVECPSFKNERGDLVKEVQCVRNQIINNPRLFMGHLKYYVKFFEQLCQKDKLRPDCVKEDEIRIPGEDDDDDSDNKEKVYYKSDFLKYMEQASGRDDLNLPIKASELGKQIILAEYVENYILLNDVLSPQGNNDGFIQLEESMVVYPRFQMILWDLAKESSGRFDDDDQNDFVMTRGLYTWLMRYGEKPKGFNQVLFWFWYKYKKGWDQIKADRILLLKILGTLAAED